MLVRYVFLCPDCTDDTFRRFPSQRLTPGEMIAEMSCPTPPLGSGKFFGTDLAGMDTIRLRAECELTRYALLWEEDRPSSWRIDRLRDVVAELRQRGTRS